MSGDVAPEAIGVGAGGDLGEMACVKQRTAIMHKPHSFEFESPRAYPSRSGTSPGSSNVHALAVGGCFFGLILLAMTALAFGSRSHGAQAFAMSLGAGAATGIGACFVLCTSSLNRTMLACTMSFSAGVMIYVSFVEVVQVSNEYFVRGRAVSEAYALATLALFAGVVLMAVVDTIVHKMFDAIAGDTHGHHGILGSETYEDDDDPESGVAPAIRASPPKTLDGAHPESQAQGDGPWTPTTRSPASGGCDSFDDEGSASIRALAHVRERRRLLMMSAVVSTAIVLHNIPEGMATYVASFHSVSAGAPLAIAIAIHNIPEGLAVAMPLLYATGNRACAVGLAALSGMSEPFGALLASFVANEDSSTTAFGGMFGLTGGMMVYVCIAELLPAAWTEKGVDRNVLTLAFFAGCAVMASSLVIEKLSLAA